MASHELTDQELVRQTRAGSLDCFEQLVYRYEGRIYRFLAGMCRNRDEARELTQTTFVKAFQALAQYSTTRSFSAWLFTIARNSFLDLRRRTAKFSVEPVPVQVDAEDPAELMARRDERAGLWDTARSTLPELQFQALWLRYAEDMQVEEIAKVLRKTRTHVKVLLFRARQLLGRQLKSAESLEITRRAVHAAPGLAVALEKGKVC